MKGVENVQKDTRIVLDGRLEVHSDGSVYKIRPDGKVKANIIINRATKQASVSLYENGKQKTYFVNRLVAEAFIPNPGNKPYVSYIDGNPSNNRVDNLTWSTKAEQVAKAKLTLKKKEKSCSVCGNTTLSEDGICASCKRIEKMNTTRMQRENDSMEQIRETFSNVELTELTYLQRKTVELRLQGMTYEEIGQVMGCSRQCVEQRLKQILEKSGKVRNPNKSARKAYLSAKNKLDKKRNLLIYLNTEMDVVKTEIQSLEQVIRSYETLFTQEFSQESKMDPRRVDPSEGPVTKNYLQP